MTQANLGFHEMMDLHELLNFKTLSLAKSKMMQGLVFDKDLKALMQEDVQISIKALHQLQNHYSNIQLQ